VSKTRGESESANASKKYETKCKSHSHRHARAIEKTPSVALERLADASLAE